jgi:tetratricopeptide (TPR) repeat protein
MMTAFQAASGELGARLLAALEAGDHPAPGGSALEVGKGFASAAILVVRAGGGSLGESDRLTDLRIDAALDPIAALKALYLRHSETYLAAAHVRYGDEAKRRGDDASATREYRAAEAGFRAAVARAPKDADALNELAWFLALHGSDAAEAVRFAEAAVVARGDDPNLWDTLAEAAYRSGSLDKAIDAAARAARLDKDNARYAERLRAFRAAKDTLLGSEKSGPAR